MIYLASPYSHPDPAVRQDRYEAACRYAGHLIMQGELVFSPIAHSHAIAMAGGLATHHEYWVGHNSAWLDACDRLVVLALDGWRESAGVQWEIEQAHLRGMTVEIHVAMWRKEH